MRISGFGLMVRGSALLLMAGLVAVVQAQYTGPTANAGAERPLTSVQQILRAASEDQPVRLTGVLVRKLRSETYAFRDATGEIEVDIDDRDFPQQRRIEPTTQVEIEGDVDRRLFRAPRIEVERMRVLGPATPQTP